MCLPEVGLDCEAPEINSEVRGAYLSQRIANSSAKRTYPHFIPTKTYTSGRLNKAATLAQDLKWLQHLRQRCTSSTIPCEPHPLLSRALYSTVYAR